MNGKREVADPKREVAEAVHERLARIHRSRLAQECAKLDKAEEQAMADEGYAGESEWPEY